MKKYYIPFITVYLFFLFSVYSFAQVSSDPSGQPRNENTPAVNRETVREEKTLQKELLRQEKARVRCERQGVRVDQHIERYENNKLGHVIAFKNMQNRLNRFIQRFEDLGYDVDKLKEDSSVLGVKIDKFIQDRDIYIEKLTESKKHACGESDGAYSESVKIAKEQLRLVRTDVTDIKTYYKTVIRPDITALKSQKPAALPVSAPDTSIDLEESEE